MHFPSPVHYKKGLDSEPLLPKKIPGGKEEELLLRKSEMGDINSSFKY